jgi:hypothetical protein
MITYDYRFVVPVGKFQIKKVKNQANRRFIVVESSNKEDQTIRFQRGAKGEEALKRISKTKTNTQIEIRSSTGVRNRVTVIADYT